MRKKSINYKANFKQQICKYIEINDENLFFNYLLISRK